MWNDKNTQFLAIGMLAVLAIVLTFNSMQLASLKTTSSQQIQQPLTADVTTASGNSYADVIPKGVPIVYGAELEVSYSDVSSANPQKADATIAKLGSLDRQITLSGENLERYKRVVRQISCEYCCGADSIIFENGEPACGCAHSYAMRGVAKYLITSHSGEFTDDQILEELGKWKTLFFPGQISQKAQVLASRGIELNYVNLASNKYRGAEQEASSSGGAMVGGC